MLAEFAGVQMAVDAALVAQQQEQTKDKEAAVTRAEMAKAKQEQVT